MFLVTLRIFLKLFPCSFKIATGPLTVRPHNNSNGENPRLSSSRKIAKPPPHIGGLHTYAKKVIEILEEKGTISINEIFEILYREINGIDDEGDEILHTRKNVYRRLGDVLNSFDAIGMISKDGKVVNWLGYPNYEEEEERKKLEAEKQKLEKGIQEKTNKWETLNDQSMSFKNLLRINRYGLKNQNQAIFNLPFIVIRTDKNTNVKCNVSSDRVQYLFTFDRPFEILDNMEVLQKMGLSKMKSECRPSSSNV